MKRTAFNSLFIFCITLIFLFTKISAQTNSTEKKVMQYVDMHNNEALTLLEQVVNINSGTMNFAGVKQVSDIFKTELDQLGFKTHWIDGHFFGRSGHLVANHPGKGRPLLLIGHLDTVFEPDSPFQKYEMIDAHTMRGPGVCDMKGGDVIIIYALKALKEAGLLKKMNITIVMSGDEENSGEPLYLARKDLVDAAKTADIALGFENGDGNPKTAVISRRSASSWRLKVAGKPAHSSQIFRKDVGAGAIYEASRILNSFYEKMSGEEYLTFNPGLILGGTNVQYDSTQSKGSAFGKNNVVAGYVTVSGDLRTISAEQLKKARTEMFAIVSQNRPGTSAKIIFNDAYPPLAPTDGNKKLLAIYDQVSRDLGYGPVTAVDPNKAGAADVSFTAKYVDMAIDGLGLGGAHDHTVQETADLTTLPQQTKRAAILIYRLSWENH